MYLSHVLIFVPATKYVYFCGLPTLLLFTTPLIWFGSPHPFKIDTMWVRKVYSVRYNVFVCKVLCLLTHVKISKDLQHAQAQPINLTPTFAQNRTCSTTTTLTHAPGGILGNFLISWHLTVLCCVGTTPDCTRAVSISPSVLGQSVQTLHFPQFCWSLPLLWK